RRRRHAAPRLREQHGRYPRRRHDRDVGDGRHLPQGFPDREGGEGRSQRGGVPLRAGEAGSRLLDSRRRAGRVDADGSRAGARRDRKARGCAAAGSDAVRAFRIVLVVVLAVWMQTALRNLLVLGTAPLDLVLVAVVYIALTA